MTTLPQRECAEDKSDQEPRALRRDSIHKHRTVPEVAKIDDFPNFPKAFPERKAVATRPETEHDNTQQNSPQEPTPRGQHPETATDNKTPNNDKTD